MKLWLRSIFGAVLVLAGAAAASGQSLSPTGISASPGSVLPGDSVTFSITVNNSTAVQFGPGATGNFTIVLTNIVSGATVTLASGNIAPTGGFIAAAAVDPTSGQVTPGTGTFTYTGTIPTQTTEAGNYRATVTLNSVSAGAVGTSQFSVSTSVLTITGKPDLEITALSYAASTSYVGGTVIPMSLTYRNNRSTNGTQNVPYVPGLGGMPFFVRIQVVLSTNPTFGDADDFQLTFLNISSGNFGSNATTDNNNNPAVLADNSTHTFSWNQILPGNFSGSYYVLAKIDSLNQLQQNDPPALNVNGNNVWIGNALNPTATLINLLPTNFPTTYLASHGTGVTTTASGYSDNPSISADGRYVAFASDATNLISGDTNNARDIFVYDSQTALVRRLSLSQQGAQGNGASNNPVVSGDGRYVAFSSEANNLVIGDSNGFSDIFVVDTLTGLISRLSGANAPGGQANNPSFRPAISQTGRYVVFQSTATNLIPGQTTATGRSHIYLVDRDVANTGTFDTAGNVATRLIDCDVTAPATAEGNGDAIQAAISPDGSWVAFASKASNLVSPSTTVGRQHVFVRPLANVGTGVSGIKMVSVANGGPASAEGNADSQTPSLSSDGRYVAFASLASNLVGGDANGVSDIFVYDNGQPLASPVVRRMSVASITNAEAVDPSPAGFKLGSINPTISADGRYVAFASLANNLTAGDSVGQAQASDSNNALDIFVHDRDSTASGTYDTVSATTTMVSVNPFGYQTNGLLGVPSTAASNIYPVISANGRFVAYPSDAENNAGLAFGVTNLLPLDSNSLRDIFLHDRRTNASVTPATPPTVTITSPGNTANALVNTPIRVAGTATTTVGVVSTVQFFVNGTSLGTSAVFPYSQTWTPAAVGNYTLSALVTDSFGNVGVSPNVTVTVVAAPSVGVTSPATGSSFTAGTTQTVTATAAASNPGATIANVQFFANGASLGTVTTAPYSISWTPGSAGSYSLTAIATDSIGTQSTSPAVAVTVIAAGGGGGAGTPPVVAISSPAGGSTVSVNTPTSVSASASSAQGAITRVDFFANGTAIGTTSAFPYVVSWTPATPGTYALTAVATDSNSLTSTSTASTVTVSSGTPPTASITSPGTGAVVALNSTQTITAAAASPTGTIASVQFLVNGSPLSTDTTFPYSALWSPTSVGTFTLVARATDNLGNVTNSSPISVSVSGGVPPAVALTSPGSGASFPLNASQTLVATATSGAGQIVSVQFMVNGTAISTDATFPYSATWTPAATGSYSLVARATDSFGNVSDSAATTVSVNAGTMPVVAISSPLSGATVLVNSAQSLSATATSSGSTIASVQFIVNGVVLSTDTIFPYSASWTPTATGSYSVVARATDSLGNVTDSSPVSVSVSGGTPPAVALTAPSSGVSVALNSTQTLTATATSSSAQIVSVQFMVNGTAISTDTTFPYSAAWTPNAIGSYSLVARATDTLGNVSDSPATTVSVNVGTMPVVTLSSPASGASVPVNATQSLSATATSSGSTIASVQFLVNGAVLSTDATFPYAGTWQPTALGSYTVVARATDGLGNVSDSAPATVSVVSGSAPAVAITNPTANGTFSLGAALNITANAVDADGVISQVAFFVNGVAQGTPDTVAPYTAQWTPTAAGSYRLTAQATDDVGNVTTSQAVTVSIVANGAPTIAITSPAAGSTATAGTPVSLTASATDADGTIAGVRYFVNGNVVGAVATVPPFLTTWTPSAAGTYSIVAEATDNSGNIANSASRSIVIVANKAPTVALTSPASGASVSSGLPVSLSALASDDDGTVVSVRFLVNANGIGVPITVAPFATNWTPTAPGTYSIIAEATDNSGNITASAARTVTVVANQAPSVALTSPKAGFTGLTGIAVNLQATATDNDGTVVRVRFLVNGNAVGAPATTAPYAASWTPVSAGTYSIVAEATDDVGNVSNSSPIVATISSNRLPAINLTSPTNGAVVRIGTSVALAATATDSDGTIASVAFAVNGTQVGSSITVFPYKGTWTPTAEGIYRITATATDDAGGTSTSSTLNVLVVDAVGATDSVYSGIIVGGAESGTFAAVNVRGKTAVLIGSSTTNGATKNYFFSGLPLSAGGNFSGSSGGRTVTGSFSDTGAFGTLDGGASFSGAVTAVGAAASVSTGYYTGNIAARPASIANAIVSGEGTIMVYLADGSFQAVGSGTVDASGAFNVLTNTGARLVGKVDPATGFLNATLNGGPGGLVLAATSAGSSFGDGSLRNLSTRGQVGTGGNVLIAGFYIAGTTPKQVLIRAVGPTIGAAPYNLAGTISDPQIQVYNSQGAPIAGLANNNWGGSATIAAAFNQVGAFPLPAASLDSAILTTLFPGTYSVQVSGVNGASGLALVELYDVDNTAPFSAQKVMNISTRGNVGPGTAQLLAGFTVGGNTSKKVLIRGVGPTLAAAPIGVTGTLADPILSLVRLVDGNWVSVRENDNWESGNDVALVAEASAKVGAFPLLSGSKDAVILINLPPGTYTAQLYGPGTTSGVALVEVYEIP